MRIALIQQHATSDKQENTTRALRAIDVAAGAGAELVTFAELGLEPFYPQHPSKGNALQLAERIPGATTERFAVAAKDKRIVVVLNLFERDGERTFDCSPVIDADGRLLGRTRMVHITDYPGFHERAYYASGDQGAPVYDTAVGRIGVAICYDRHFPEYMRALALGGAALIVIPQAGVVDEWADNMFEAEMQATAFQNGCFIALCNRVGREEQLTFAGESFVCAPDGRVIARAAKLQDSILYADIDLKDVERSHARRVFFKDRRPDLYAAWLGERTMAR
jgi:beta-ureidopropionase